MTIRTLFYAVLFSLCTLSCDDIVDYTITESTFACYANNCGFPCSERLTTNSKSIFCAEHYYLKYTCLGGGSGGSGSDGDIKVYSGSSTYNLVYTVRGDQVYSGSSTYNLVYTIRGNQIYEGNSTYNVAYTVRGNTIYEGYSTYNVAYTIR
jgi:hypothetical protein